VLQRIVRIGASGKTDRRIAALPTSVVSPLPKDFRFLASKNAHIAVRNTL